MSEFIEHYLVEKDSTLADFCSGKLCWSEPYYEEILGLGGIYVNKRRCLSDTELKVGDYLRLHIKPKRYPLVKNIADKVLHREDDFYIVHKSAGLPCHATLDNYKENLIYQLQAAGFEDLLLTHRLDVDTEGLIVFARNKNFQTKFNAMLSEHLVTKIYHAFSDKTLVPATYKHFMKNTNSAPKILSASQEEGDLKCELKILAAESGRHVIELISGRTHQIRAQMAFLGAAILGDSLYGGKDSPQLQLYAKKISFMYEQTYFSYELP